MNTLALFNRFSKLPAGSLLFSWAVSFTAPYFRSIRPRIEALTPGYVRVSMRKRRRVQNHLGTVHAVAMCNMAELAGGMMTEVSVPPGSRWIPSGMSVQYLKKAKTDLVAIADGRDIDWSREGEVLVPVVIRDTQDQIVFTAAITMNIKH